MEEEFRDIPNYEGIYQVSNTGVVKSLQRILIRKDGVKVTLYERLLKYQINRNGYLQTMLYTEKSERKLINIHRLVALAFLGIPKAGMLVNHIDRDKKNNNLSNLEYVTARENVVLSLDKSKTSSKYVGVRKFYNRWRASKSIDGIRYYLGSFETEEEARDSYINFIK